MPSQFNNNRTLKKKAKETSFHLKTFSSTELAIKLKTEVATGKLSEVKLPGSDNLKARKFIIDTRMGKEN